MISLMLQSLFRFIVTYKSNTALKRLRCPRQPPREALTMLFERSQTYTVLSRPPEAANAPSRLTYGQGKLLGSPRLVDRKLYIILREPRRR